MKFIRPERAATDPTLVQRFDNEAKAAARIASAHVVHIHDYGLEDGTPYLVMEMLEGRSLDAAARRGWPHEAARARAGGA